MVSADDIAVVANRNAQGATRARLAQLAALVPARQLFVTATPERAHAAMQEIVARGYRAVCIAGGDGTFLQALRDLAALGSIDQLPLFALRLGTGNAIGEVCGASPPSFRGLRRDLERVARTVDTAPLRLLRANGRLSYFAGIGADATFIADLHDLVKRRLAVLGPLIRGIPGIAATAILRTIPRLICEPGLTVRVTNAGGPARRLRATGAEGAAIAPGELLFEGRATICAASTIETFGRGFRFFPFADRVPGTQFHLRIASAGPAEIVARLPSLFAGTYDSPGKLWDFAADAVTIESAAPTALQIGGDPAPPVQTLTLSTSPDTARILRPR